MELIIGKYFVSQTNVIIIIIGTIQQFQFGNIFAMKSQENQYRQPLILLKKYLQYLTNRPQQHTEILVHQRLIYIIATALENKQPLPKGVALLPQISSFINNINIKVMSSNTLDFQEKLNLISKCIDMLFFKPVRSQLKPVEKLLQLRALCFNNLSCLYKENKQSQDALKALEVALQIQQTLLDKNYQDTYKSIASTYINKCVILSGLSHHQQAIETIKSSLQNIDRYRGRYGSEITQKQNNQLRHMTMLAYYNIAVQHQHLGHNQLAIKFYETSFKEAKELGNWAVKNQIISALKKLKKK